MWSRDDVVVRADQHRVDIRGGGGKQEREQRLRRAAVQAAVQSVISAHSLDKPKSNSERRSPDGITLFSSTLSYRNQSIARCKTDMGWFYDVFDVFRTVPNCSDINVAVTLST